MKKRRALSLLLALLIATSALFPVPVQAADEVETESFYEDFLHDDDESLGMAEFTARTQTNLVELNCVSDAPESEPVVSLSPHLDGEEMTLGSDDMEEFPENSLSTMYGTTDELGMDENDEESAAPEGEDDSLGAFGKPSLSASKTSVSIKKGDTVSVTLTAKNFSGYIFLRYSSNNTAAFSASWGSWYRGSVPLTIKGTGLGRGTITVYMVSSSTKKVLTSTSIAVSVTSPEVPKLTLSASSKNISVGQTQSVNITVSGYSGAGTLQVSNVNKSVYSCSWGSWSGRTTSLNIRGIAPGSGTITLSLLDTTGTVLAQASISVSVYRAQTPKVTVSSSNVSLKAGQSTTVSVAVSGYSGRCTLRFVQTDQKVFKCAWGKWSGNGAPLTISGLNAGSGSVTVHLMDQDKQILATTTISPVTITKSASPSVSASYNSVAVERGHSVKVGFTPKNVSDRYYLRCKYSEDSPFRCQWNGWEGSAAALHITGNKPGSGSVTVYLMRKSDNAILASTSVNVVVKDYNLQNIAFGFDNYSCKSGISQRICEYMYGKGRTADNLYNAKKGAGGVCFGMAAGAGLIDVRTNSPYVSDFSPAASRISDLEKRDYNRTLGLSLTDYIEAVHLSQYASTMREKGGLNDLVSTVKSETDAGRPVVISIRGRYNGKAAGHAVLAYGYREVSDTEFEIKVYDSNWVNSKTDMTPSTLTVKKLLSILPYTSWRYKLFKNSDLYWGTGEKYEDISFIPYSTYFSVWNNHGHLSAPGYNLLSVKDANFSVYNFDGELVAKYEDGVLTQKADDVMEVLQTGLMPDGDIGEQVNLLYVPVDLYTVRDDSADTPIEVYLSHEQLSVQIITDADEFDLCADDESDFANAILTPSEGTAFSVTLGSCRPDTPEETTVEGIGTGEPISMSMENGQLSILGAECAELSMMNFDEEYALSVSASEGGSVTHDGSDTVVEGSNVRCRIVPDEGYSLYAVYVDGEDIGAVSECYFENVQANHTVYAQFVRNINACTVELSCSEFIYDGTAHQPAVTVTDASGVTLTEGLDYELTFSDNTQVGTAIAYVTALDSSNYIGVQTVTFQIVSDQTGIRQAVYLPEDNAVRISLVDCQPTFVMVASYDGEQAVSIELLRVDENIDVVELPLRCSPVKNDLQLRAFVLDENMIPVCESMEILLPED